MNVSIFIHIHEGLVLIFSSQSLNLRPVPSLLMTDERICSPPFMVLNSECSPDLLEQIKKQGLTFPFSKSNFLPHM